MQTPKKTTNTKLLPFGAPCKRPVSAQLGHFGTQNERLPRQLRTHSPPKRPNAAHERPSGSAVARLVEPGPPHLVKPLNMWWANLKFISKFNVVETGKFEIRKKKPSIRLDMSAAVGITTLQQQQQHTIVSRGRGRSQ